MDGTEKLETLSSAVAFVEGGIQDACEDSCSICLEAFCDSDPSTVTGCKHEFHLQCILEWCQRSSQCPMCWQAISLKDPISQELLEAVERERSIRFNQSRNTTIFHHPTLGDFELQHVGANEAELEERIIQHLAAAAAMGRAHHVARRDGQQSRSGAQGRPQFLVFSSHPNAPPAGPASVSSGLRVENDSPAAFTVPSPSVTLAAAGEEPQNQVSSSTPAIQVPVMPSGTTSTSVNSLGHSNNRIFAGLSTPAGQDRAGPSDFQSFSESLKSRFNAVSMRYKDSITKSTRGWKEKLFSRNTSNTDIGSEATRDVNAGIATVSRMMEHLDTRENSISVSISHSSEGNSVTETSNPMNTESRNENLPTNTNASVSCATASNPK